MIRFAILALTTTLFIMVVTLASAKADTSFAGPIIDPLLHPQVYCLAQNVYYEARNDSRAGKYAVADAALNRVENNYFPNTVCGVVQQGSLNSGKVFTIRKQRDGTYKRFPSCQFSWFCDGKSDVPVESEDWRLAQAIAWQIKYYGKFRGITEGADHYHADYVDPVWADSLLRISQIGHHIFYRSSYRRR